MSKPKRYDMLKMTCSRCEQDDAYLQAAMTTNKNGRWVCYDDYAALAAENERLRSASFVTAVPSEEYEKLKAENERLRKAGDELYKWAGAENRPPQQVYAAWNAAKEGGAK